MGKELQFFCYFSPSTLPRLLCFSRLAQRKRTRGSFPQFFAPLHSLPSGVSCNSPARLNETGKTATRTALLIRKLKQQRQRRLRKRHLKVNSRCLKLHRAYSISFNSSNVGKLFLELNSKGLYQSSRKEKASCCLVFPSSTKREIGHLH